MPPWFRYMCVYTQTHMGLEWVKDIVVQMKGVSPAWWSQANPNQSRCHPAGHPGNQGRRSEVREWETCPSETEDKVQSLLFGVCQAICLEEDLHSCGVCFLASFLTQSPLPRGTDKSSKEGTPVIPRGPVSRFLPWSVNKYPPRRVSTPPPAKGGLFSDPLSSCR